MKLCMVDHCRFPATHVTKGHKCGTCDKYGHGQVEHGDLIKKTNLQQFLCDIVPYYMQCTKPNCSYKSLHTFDGHMCGACNQNHSYMNCPKNYRFHERKLQHEQLFDKIQYWTAKCPLCNVDSRIDIEKHKIYGIENNCMLCMTNKANILFECKHISLCEECFNETKMPVNLEENNEIVEIYEHDAEIKLQLALIKRGKFIDKPIYTVIYSGMGCCWLVRRDKYGDVPEHMFVHSDDCHNFAVIAS